MRRSRKRCSLMLSMKDARQETHLGSVLHGGPSGRNLGSVSLDKRGEDGVGERELNQVLGDVLLHLVLGESLCRRDAKGQESDCVLNDNDLGWTERTGAGRTSGPEGLFGEEGGGDGLVRDSGNELVVDNVDLTVARTKEREQTTHSMSAVCPSLGSKLIPSLGRRCFGAGLSSSL